MDFRDVTGESSHLSYLEWFEKRPEDEKNSIRAEMKQYLDDMNPFRVLKPRQVEKKPRRAKRRR